MRSFSLLLIMILLVTSCTHKSERKTKNNIVHYGALRTIMSGNIKAVASLDSLASLKYLYALGAQENLGGEIQVFNGEAFNSIVKDSVVKISNSFDEKASLLVYAQVNDWESFELPESLSKPELETSIKEIANEYGLNINEPFPFLLEGRVAELNWHVINWNERDSIHNHKKHRESGLNGILRNKKVKILGFYSKNHKGVFTHHTSNMHMHFKARDTSLAGHVDNLRLTRKINLRLPKR